MVTADGGGLLIPLSHTQALSVARQLAARFGDDGTCPECAGEGTR